jgi:hypothetical protein
MQTISHMVHVLITDEIFQVQIIHMRYMLN